MIHFSETKQAFYDTELEYTDLPADLIEITSEQHQDLLCKINSGYHIFVDLTCSEQKPSSYHTWTESGWQDLRSDTEKEAIRLAQFRALTHRQFKLALLEYNLLEQIETSIQQIEDEKMRQRINIEYTEANEFHRTSESVMFMYQLISLTDQQVDEMWNYAMSL